LSCFANFFLAFVSFCSLISVVTTTGDGCKAGYYGTGLTMDTSGTHYDCDQCPNGMTTKVGPASTTIADCICIDGYAPDTNGCIDNTPPTIVCPATITRETARDYSSNLTRSFTQFMTWPLPTISDNSGILPSLSEPSLPMGDFEAGTYTIDYSATDAVGLSSSCSFTVTITIGKLPLTL
jgi:hypothetical protein